MNLKDFITTHLCPSQKAPAKKSSENICFSHLLHYLLTLSTDVSVEANSVGPRMLLSIRFAQEASKTFQQMTKRQTTRDRRFKDYVSSLRFPFTLILG